MRRGLDRLNRSLEDARDPTGDAYRRATRASSWLVAIPGPGEGFVTGDAVNVAARLEQGADSGQILVGERTVRAARDVSFRELGHLTPEGEA